jgi:lysyl-tRNA synthetase class 2
MTIVSVENNEVAHRAQLITLMRADGIEPFPHGYQPTHTAAAIRQAFDGIAAGCAVPDVVQVAGRVMAMRQVGGQTFVDIADGSGGIQLSLRREALGEESYQSFTAYIDRGDILGVTGTPMRTRRGELSVHATGWKILCKAIRPLPAKDFVTAEGLKRGGLVDAELKYRQPEVRMIVDPAFRLQLRRRSNAIRAMRSFLEDAGFIDLEIPTLQPSYGGASARPFITHLNALSGTPLYLSISPEIYLKRLVVGGFFEGVFTICKNFRNEGIDRTHNPEFTMMECYRAWWDYNDLMVFLEKMWAHIFMTVIGTTTVEYEMPGIATGKQVLNFAPPWRRARMTDLIQEQLDLDVLSMTGDQLHQTVTAGRAPLLSGKPPARKPSWGELVQLLFEEHVEKTLVQPTFVTDHPRESTPLCKSHRSDPRLIERFEPFVYGVEIANAYTELNDPVLQRQLLTEQAAGAEGCREDIDEPFCRSIEYGMPPTAGLGVGVDRLVMFLTGASTIRDVIPFPFMRTE